MYNLYEHIKDNDMMRYVTNADRVHVVIGKAVVLSREENATLEVSDSETGILLCTISNKGKTIRWND